MSIIFRSLFVIAVMTAVAGGATYAFFNYHKSVGGNVLGASTEGVNIVLGGTGSETVPYFNVTDMYPGQTKVSYLVIKNPNASIDALFRIYAEQTSSTPWAMRDKLLLQVTLNPSGYSGTQNLLANGYKLYGAPDNILVKWEDGKKLSDLIGKEKALDNIGAWKEDDSWPLKKGYAAVYKIEVMLDKNANNDYKGAKWEGNLVIDAVQADFQEGEVIW